MSFDPFFKVNVATTADKSTRNIHSVLIGFFLCSFDNANGVQILFSSPTKLQKDSNELNILKTHCVWKMEKIPLRIDLKFSEFNYSAFQLDFEKEIFSEMIELPLFVVVLKIWKAGDKIPVERLITFKTDLEQNFSKDIELLYKFNIYAKNPIKRREIRELSSRIPNIEKELRKLWIKLIREIENRYFSDLKLEEDTVIPSISRQQEIRNRDLFKSRIGIRTITLEENPDQLILVLINQGKDLEDVNIQLSKRTDFFSETHWEQRIDLWPYKEEIFLDFSKSDITQKFLIKISSHEATVTIKSFEVGRSISHIHLEETV